MSEINGLNIIISPHCDDEIIGVYKYLKEANIIIYDGDTDRERRSEALNLKNHIRGNQIFLKSIPLNLLDKKNKYYFPDPHFEIHPLHRRWGNIGEEMSRDGYDIIFYNTIMNAPYIHEVKNPSEKEILLNKIYPSQRDLWKYEKKYILFEGYNKWIF